VTIRDVARPDVVTIHRTQTAGNVATVMKDQNVGSVVVEDEGAPVGIVTDRDLAMEVLEPRADPAELTAGEIMTEHPTTVHMDHGVFEVTRMLSDAKVRRLPVVDDEGSIAGIVTLDDLLVLFTDEMNGLATVVEAESPPY
jgi:CBS domain-containing protein